MQSGRDAVPVRERVRLANRHDSYHVIAESSRMSDVGRRMGVFGLAEWWDGLGAVWW